MTNRSLKPAAGDPVRKRSTTAVARFELVFKDGLSGNLPRTELFIRLKKLGALGKATIGESYARVAGSVLQMFERLDDRNAELRQRRRSPALARDENAARRVAP